MWYRIGDRKRFNNEQLELEILQSTNMVSFLDAPSFCGKTYFLLHMNSSVEIVSCRHFVNEYIMQIMIEKKRKESILKRLQEEYRGKIIALEDVDYCLRGKPFTQGELAFLVALLSQTNRVVLTGIDIRSSCRGLMQHIIIKECDNKNQMHQNKIEIEEWIREFRQMKKRSRKVIEEEESVLKLAEEKLKILEDIRTDLNNK